MAGKIFIDTQSANEMLDNGLVYVIDSTLLQNEDSRIKHFENRIRGAKYFSIAEIRDTSSPLSLAWPTFQQFIEAMIKIRLPNDGKTVIVYDQTGFGTAARGWATLKYFGYPNVFILDGGLPKWLAEGRPTETGEYQLNFEEPADWRQYLVTEHHEMRVLIDTVERIVNQRNSGDNSVSIWDPRPPNMFQAGTVPTAVNLPASTFFNADKTVKSPEEVRELLHHNGLEGQVIASCMKGNNASLGYALQKYVGNDHAYIYTGSYEEWKKIKG